MKRKLLAMVCAVSMIASLGAATVYASDDVKATGDEKIALITMDSIDQHWITLNEGAQEEAKELGVTVDFMSPNTKDDAQQIECVNNAVAGGYDAIMVAANGPDAISSALQEAKDQGIKIVYVDSPANVEAEATFSTDNEAAGTTAGEEMKKALEDAGITSGKIGIINVNAATDSCVNVRKASAQHLTAQTSRSWKPSTAKVMLQNPRVSQRTTLHRVLLVSSDVMKAPQLVPEMPSKQLETLTSSVLVLINLTRF